MAVPMTANVVLSLAGLLGPAALVLLTCIAPHPRRSRPGSVLD
jgi:hypothetical protein